MGCYAPAPGPFILLRYEKESACRQTDCYPGVYSDRILRYQLQVIYSPVIL